MAISSVLSSAANGVMGAATFTASAVPALLTGTAAVAGAAGSAVVGVVPSSGAVKKGVLGVAGGAVTTNTAGLVIMKVAGFTAAGPAAGSWAAALMSSIAVANGGGVAAGSLYSVVQATAMTSGVLLGAPAVLAAGAVAGAVAWNRYG